MTDTMRPRNGTPARAYAPLTNMRLGLQTLMDLKQAEFGCDRMGLLYGFAGYGKSSAGRFAAHRLDGCFVECHDLMTKRSLLVALAEDLEIHPIARTAEAIYRQICDELERAPRPIVLDEADHLVRKGLIELVRAIHDKSGVPVLLIGEEEMPAKLKKWDRCDGRILVATPAQPASVEDALMLRDHYRGRVLVTDDLVHEIGQRTRWVARRIVQNLHEIQRRALEEGRDGADLAWWGNRPMRTGDIQSRRAA